MATELGVNETAGTGRDGLAALIKGKVAPAASQSSPPDQMAKAEGQQYGEATAKTRLGLKAKANVWMRVEDGAEKTSSAPPAKSSWAARWISKRWRAMDENRKCGPKKARISMG